MLKIRRQHWFITATQVKDTVPRVSLPPHPDPTPTKTEFSQASLSLSLTHTHTCTQAIKCAKDHEKYTLRFKPRESSTSSTNTTIKISIKSKKKREKKEKEKGRVAFYVVQKRIGVSRESTAEGSVCPNSWEKKPEGVSLWGGLHRIDVIGYIVAPRTREATEVDEKAPISPPPHHLPEPRLPKKKKNTYIHISFSSNWVSNFSFF